MRSLIIIALCFVLANAYNRDPTHQRRSNKHRFERLVNQYRQNPYQNQYDEQEEQGERGLFGSDDVDDYINDYVDEIRRGRSYEREQCPRDIDETGDRYNRDDESEYGQLNEYDQEYNPRQSQYRRHHRTNDLDQEDEYTNTRRNQQYRREHEDEDEYNRYGRRHRQSQDFDDEYTRYGRRQQQQQYEDEQPEEREYPRERRYEQESEEEYETTGPKSRLLKEVTEANVQLASRLYKQSKDEKDDKNTVVSPLSIQLALAALNAGARGNTKRQIGRVIGGRLQKQERKQVFRQLVRQLKGLRQSEYGPRQQTTKIQPVTGIFVTKTTRAQQFFVQQVKRNLGANLKQCNFQRQPQQCRRLINKFVEEKTQGKIHQIVPQDAITDNTKMILVNALNLKAPFGQQVRRHQTKEAKFYPLDSKKVKIVEVLETKGRFKYYEDELVKIVGLPTEQKELTLYVIVPKDKDGLTDVENLHLQDGIQLKQLLDNTDKRVRRVGLQLPKFQIKHKIDVRRTLRKQGVTDAFDSQRADFSGITGSNNQYENEQRDEYEYEQTSRRRNPFVRDEDEYEYGQQNQQKDTKLHLNKFIHQTTIKITDNGITATTGSESPIDHESEQTNRGYGHRSSRYGDLEQQEEEEESLNPFDEITGFHRREQTGQKRFVKANRAFAFVVKHNPTNQLVLVGRVIDASQRKINQVPQTINNVDQL